MLPQASFKNQDHYDMEMPREQMEKLANFLAELNGEELDGTPVSLFLIVWLVTLYFIFWGCSGWDGPSINT